MTEVQQPRRASGLGLPVRGPKGRVALTPDEWPELDRAAWQRALRPGSRLRAAPAADWRPATRAAVEKSYGMWLAWLHAAGRLVLGEAPAARATPDAMEAYLAALRDAGQSEATISLRLTKLVDALNVLDPDAAPEFTGIARFARGLRQRLSDDRARELAFGVSARDLLWLGHELMAEGDELAVRGRARKGLRGAVRFRDGLLMALQALVVLRPAALLSLELGTSAIRSEEGWRLVVASSRDKAGRRRDIPVAVDLTEAMDRYVQIHRPRLAAQAKGEAPTAFWLSDRGLPLSAVAAWRAVTEPAARRLGVAPSIHRFRHVAASDVAISAPEMLGVMPGVLGHADHRPLVEHYDTATRTIANKAYAASLDRERGEAATAFLRRHRRRAGNGNCEA